MFLDAKDAPIFAEACRKDPLLFAKVVWGRRRWAGQRRIRKALGMYAMIAIFSGNGVGKTSEIATYVIEDVVLNPGTRWTLTGPRLDSVVDNVFAEIRDLYFDAKRRGLDLGGEMQTEEWSFDERWDVKCMTADEPTAYQGRRGKARTKVLVDEAQAVLDATVWSSLDSLCACEDSQFVVSGNPLQTAGRFRELCTDSTQGFHPITIDSLDHPNYVTGKVVIPGVTKEWIERKRKLGERHPEWIARVRGRFPAASPDQLISEDWIRNGAALYAASLVAGATPRIVLPEMRGPRVGMDVSYGGDDLCVCSAIKDGVLVEQDEWGHETRTDISAGRLVGFAQRHGIKREDAWRVKVDVAAGGAGVVSECHRLGWAVEAVNFGEGPANDWPDVTADMELRNRRCELHWVAARLIENGDLIIPDDPHDADRFRRTKEDLLQPKYRYPNSVFTIEKKDDIKKRISRSPDHGDSIIIALANQTGGGCGLTRVRVRSW